MDINTFLEGRKRDYVVNALLAFLIIVTLFFVAKTVNELKRSEEIGGYETINIQGEGEVFAVPDTASFTFTVQEEAETVAVAQEAVTERTNAILEYLEENGVEESNIKTVGYNVYPRYEYQRAVSTAGDGSSGGIEPDIAYYPEGRQVLVGYEVSHTIEVKVKDTTLAGELLSGLGSREVSNVSGLNFTVEDEEAVQTEAREMAIEDAKEKAEELADQLDIRLGDIVSFYEETPGYPMPYYERSSLGMGGDDAMEEFAQSAPSIPAGENKVISRVNLTYRIK